MPIQKLDFSGLSLERLQLFLVPDPSAPKERVVEEVEEKEQEVLDEFETRRRQFFQP